MTNVTIVTPWRDGIGLMLPYFDRIKALDWPADNLRLVHVEGDSTDGTYAALNWWVHHDPRNSLVRCDTGKPHYPSIVNAERFWVLATVYNAGLDAVDYAWTDYVLFLPSDVRYEPDLLQRLAAHKAAMVAPLVFQRNQFYDIWAFSRNGRNLPPFLRHETGWIMGVSLVEMDTIGCTILIDAAILRAGVRYSTVDVDRGFCTEARRRGYSIFADPTLHVEHYV
jgi:hypothetical protein